jgi:S-adenosylmethionine-dependent methyltransferase
MSTIVEERYDQTTQIEWGRLDRHRTEFALSLRALSDYLPPPPAMIADIGGGPGRYAIELARKGYQVTLVDLAQNNLNLAQHQAAAAGVKLFETVHANAMDLGVLASNTYDAVLLMGPLYHLLALPERQKARDEARRISKPGGVIFAAFLGRFAAVLNAARVEPEYIVREIEECETILESGVYHADKNSGKFPDAYFAHPEEIKPFMEEAEFETLMVLGCEGVVNTLDDKFNGFQGQLWEAWVNMNYRLGKDPSVHGASNHLLYVGKKRKN